MHDLRETQTNKTHGLSQNGRVKGAGPGSAEDTRASHCNSLSKAVIWFDTVGAVCMHCDVRRMIATTELSNCTCVWKHQTEKKQVGAQRDFAVTCASCETCPFVGVVKSTVERMTKPLFECTVLTAPCTTNEPTTTNDPTHHGRERFACKCTASEAQCMCLKRLLLRATNVSAKGANETIQLFEPHLITALPPVRTLACAKLQTTSGVPSNVCCVLCVVCCLLLHSHMACTLRVRGHACCVLCECVCVRVGVWC